MKDLRSKLRIEDATDLLFTCGLSLAACCPAPPAPPAAPAAPAAPAGAAERDEPAEGLSWEEKERLDSPE